jgi:hypothetical protein
VLFSLLEISIASAGRTASDGLGEFQAGEMIERRWVVGSRVDFALRQGIGTPKSWMPPGVGRRLRRRCFPGAGTCVRRGFFGRDVATPRHHAQFTRIANFLGEDEIVGFGLYQSDQETEPAEWRCLSKRDAMRFGEEIKLLAAAAGERLEETHLPAVMNGSVAGRRLFKDRREREALAADPPKSDASRSVPKFVREMESSLSRRIGMLEEEAPSRRAESGKSAAART